MRQNQENDLEKMKALSSGSVIASISTKHHQAVLVMFPELRERISLGLNAAASGGENEAQPSPGS